jgi:hypothetical protein
LGIKCNSEIPLFGTVIEEEVGERIGALSGRIRFGLRGKSVPCSLLKVVMESCNSPGRLRTAKEDMSLLPVEDVIACAISREQNDADV